MYNLYQQKSLYMVQFTTNRWYNHNKISCTDHSCPEYNNTLCHQAPAVQPNWWVNFISQLPFQSSNSCRQLFEMNLHHQKILYVVCDILSHAVIVCTVMWVWFLLSVYKKGHQPCILRDGCPVNRLFGYFSLLIVEMGQPNIYPPLLHYSIFP